MSRISRPLKEDLDRLSIFISRLQRHKATTIGYFDRTPDEIKLYLEELEPGWIETTLMIEEEGEILGIIIAEYDIELRRVWIHGPMVDLPNQIDWNSYAVELYENLLQKIIPTEINDYELYGEKSNINLRKLTENFGYKTTDPSCVLSFSRSQITTLLVLSLDPISEDYFDQFKNHHSEIFPNTYYSAQQILNMLDEANQVFIESHNKDLVGFIHGKLDKSNNQGYIDFVGVEKSARKQGTGRKLVIAILHWLFDTFTQINEVKLTVSEKNTPAYNLYTSLGFKVEQTLQGYRKKDDKHS
ncbi:MAG: GNAT family N-acetyltransferase [Candidatus Heimdallarchaeota archaeon]|nr:GNAT family N-acetyltransferase [Candidatus Heimdallarchaeota archaeon]